MRNSVLNRNIISSWGWAWCAVMWVIICRMCDAGLRDIEMCERPCVVFCRDVGEGILQVTVYSLHDGIHISAFFYTYLFLLQQKEIRVKLWTPNTFGPIDFRMGNVCIKNLQLSDVSHRSRTSPFSIGLLSYTELKNFARKLVTGKFYSSISKSLGIGLKCPLAHWCVWFSYFNVHLLEVLRNALIYFKHAWKNRIFWPKFAEFSSCPDLRALPYETRC